VKEAKSKKRTTIRKRVLQAMLLLSIIPLVVSAAAGVFTSLRLASISTESSHQIGDLAASGSSEALIELSLADTTELAKSTASVLSVKLGALGKDLKIVASSISDLYINPSNYKEASVLHGVEIDQPGQHLYWALSPGMVQTPHYDERDLNETGLREEMYRYANVEELFGKVLELEPTISSVFIATASGLGMAFDDKAAEKSALFQEYEHRNLDWYLATVETKGLYVTPIYMDGFGRGPTITMAIPCYGKDGEFVAVAGFDIVIKNIQSLLQETAGSISEGAYAMLYDDKRIVSAPGITADMSTDDWAALEDYVVDETGGWENQLAEAPSGYIRGNNHDGDIVYASWATVDYGYGDGWDIIFVLPESDITANATKTSDAILALTEETTANQRQQLTFTLFILAILIVVFALVATASALRISKRTTEPIQLLAAEIGKIGGDNLTYQNKIQTGDEIEDLGLAFENMTKELQEYLTNLASITAEKERIGAELTVASQIQTSMLPCIFPPFPDRSEFSIFGTMTPAREVGGDFYDFFLIDDRRLCVVIADVSGKSIPAALFMVIAKTLIKNNAQMALPPSAVLDKVNMLLNENNDASMFVTAFIGYLDIVTGSFVYSNAGHNQPFIGSAAKGFHLMDSDPALPLGALRDIIFEEGEKYIVPGDMIFLYTDGVTEALNTDEELYSDERLTQTLNGAEADTPEMLIDTVGLSLAEFTDGEEQFDDITMLAIRYEGIDKTRKYDAVSSYSEPIPQASLPLFEPEVPAASETKPDDLLAAATELLKRESLPEDLQGAEFTASVQLEAKLDNLQTILEFAAMHLRRTDLSETSKQQMLIAAEEIFVNISQYAYKPARGIAGIGISSDKNSVSIYFYDKSKPYDPLKREDPDITLSAEDRQIGGLGIFMVKQMMDDVKYRYEGGFNKLTIVKYT
jgi:sigma-B regulation protein RsbU (phosphoserine phosphatase)